MITVVVVCVFATILGAGAVEGLRFYKNRNHSAPVEVKSPSAIDYDLKVIDLEAELDLMKLPIPDSMIGMEKCPSCKHRAADHVISCFGGSVCSCRLGNAGAQRAIRDARNTEIAMKEAEIKKTKILAKAETTKADFQATVDEVERLRKENEELKRTQYPQDKVV